MSKSKIPEKKHGGGEDEFLWLMSLSDLMILLFIFFVVMYSFSAKRMKQNDFVQMFAKFRHEAAPKDPVDEVKKKVSDWVQQQKLHDAVSVKKVDDGLQIDIVDKLLFTTGEFVPHSEGARVMGLMSSILDKVPVPYQIAIEGHTDDDPIHTKTIKDNWDLAAKRAHAVMQSLRLSAQTLKRVVLMSYGDQRPVVPNRDSKGNAIPLNQAKNRRVTIRVF